MKKTYPIILKYAIVLAIVAFLIWLSFHHFTQQNWRDMVGAMQQARYILLLPVFILMLLSHYLRSLRWKQLIEPMGYNPPLLDLFCALLTGYLANQFLPRGGEVIRCTVITKKHKIPVEKLIGTIISERAVDVLCLLIVGVSIFFIEYSMLSTPVQHVLVHNPAANTGTHGINWVAVAAIAAGLVLLVFIISRVGKTFSSFLVKILRGFKEGFLSIKKVRSRSRFIAYTIGMWACYIITTWVGCFAMQATQQLGLTTAVVLLFAGSLGIIVTPGGVAAYPIAIQKVVTLYGINEDIGLAFGWLLWCTQFIFTIVFGTLAYIIITKRAKKYEKHIIRSA